MKGQNAIALGGKQEKRVQRNEEEKSWRETGREVREGKKGEIKEKSGRDRKGGYRKEIKGKKGRVG